MIDELAMKLTDFFYDYDTYEFKDNYEDYNEGLEETTNMLSSKNDTRKLIYNLKEINDDLSCDDDNQIKEFFNRSSKLLDELINYEKSLKEDYVV